MLMLVLKAHKRAEAFRSNQFRSIEHKRAALHMARFVSSWCERCPVQRRLLRVSWQRRMQSDWLGHICVFGFVSDQISGEISVRQTQHKHQSSG